MRRVSTSSFSTSCTLIADARERTLAREKWQLYLTLGALVGSGINCLAYTGQSLYLTRWFVQRRGLALSIAFSGVGTPAALAHNTAG